MTVSLWLKEASQPIEFDGVANTYQKGSFYCIFVEAEDIVFKYPIENIFRTIESYGAHGTHKIKKSSETTK